MEAQGNNVHFPIFVSTNVDTHLLVSSSPSDTVGDLRGKIKNGHLFCFPHCGDIDIGALMVRHESLVYHLPDSIFVETAFHGSNGTRFLLAEVSGSGLCNQQECKILSGKDGNFRLLMKSKKCEFQRQLDGKSNGTSLDVQHGKSKKMKKGKLVTEGLQVKEGHGQFINNEECTDLVVAIEEKVVANDEFAKDSKSPGSRDETSDPRVDKRIKKRRKKLHDLNGDLAEFFLSSCKETSKRDQTSVEAEDIAQCLSEQVLENIEMDKSSPVGKITIQHGKSKKKKKGKLVTEGLQVKEGHGQFINNEECTDLVVVIEEKVVANDEFAKDSKSPGSRDETSDPRVDKRIKKRRKKLHDLNGNLAEFLLSPCKEKSKRDQTSAEAEDIAQCLSERVLENIEMDKSSPVGKITIEEKASTSGTLNSVKDNGTKFVLLTVENLCCEQQSLLRNIHTDADKEHVTGGELGTGRKHEISSKIFHEERSLNQAAKELDGLQGKADDARECDTEKKVKSKRTKSSKSALDDDREICFNDVNGVCQITKQSHLHEYKYGETEETSARECNIEKKKLNRKRKMSSKHGLGDGDHKISTKDVYGEPQMTKHTHLLECKCHKPEENCGVSVVSDKNAHTKDAMSGSVKYLDFASHTESHQQFNIYGKWQNKPSMIDMSMVDCQEKIAIEPVQKNNAKYCTGEGDKRIKTVRGRDISSENEVTYMNLQHSKMNATTDLEHVPETIGTTPLTNHQNCNDKKVKSSRNSPSKNCQERTFNIEKREIEEVVAKGHGASIVSEKNGQAKTKNAMSGPLKYLEVSNHTENQQQCNITGKKNNNQPRNDMSRVDAQERITTEKVPKNDLPLDSGKGERDVTTLGAGHKNKRDIPSDNGGMKYPSAHHSKINAARDHEHITRMVGTAPMVKIEDCNDKEELKPSKNSPLKNNGDRTANFEKGGIDEVAAKGGNSVQNVMNEEKKPKDIYPISETLFVCENKFADDGLKLKSSAVPEGSGRNQSLIDEHANNYVLKKHQSVDRNLVKRRKGSADVGCKVNKTTTLGFDKSDTNHSLGQKEDTGIRDFKFQSTAENCAHKSLQIEKLDTNDLSYMNKSPKEHQGDVNFTGKIQPDNEKVAPQRNTVESCGHSLKKIENSSTADTTQSSENKKDIDFRTNHDRFQGEDWLYDGKDISVSCPSQKQIPVFVANDVYGDGQCAGEETGFDCKPGKLQLAGRAHDGLSMNKAISKNTISLQMEKSLRYPKVDNHSKKNHISLFRSSSDVSKEGENEHDSYMVSSSSKRFSSDSSDSHDSDAGNRDKILKLPSIKPQTDWEPSTSGARLSTAVGKNKDSGGTGSIHSKFVHLLAKKTGLGELFKIARAQQKPESEHFGGDFMADDSPSVDLVLETQDSQIDPVFNAHHNRELTTSPIIADETKEDGKMSSAEVAKANSALKSHAEAPKASSTSKSHAEAPKANSASKSHPDGTHKVSWKSNSPLPSNNSVQLKKHRKAFNR